MSVAELHGWQQFVSGAVTALFVGAMFWFSYRWLEWLAGCVYYVTGAADKRTVWAQGFWEAADLDGDDYFWAVRWSVVRPDGSWHVAKLYASGTISAYDYAAYQASVMNQMNVRPESTEPLL
jgi:hypothetical protein